MSESPGSFRTPNNLAYPRKIQSDPPEWDPGLRHFSSSECEREETQQDGKLGGPNVNLLHENSKQVTTNQ